MIKPKGGIRAGMSTEIAAGCAMDAGTIQRWMLKARFRMFDWPEDRDEADARYERRQWYLEQKADMDRDRHKDEAAEKRSEVQG